ncbi:5-(carboxyamino)imidazole ribonucleotide mutase [Globicatella sulfidifaciens]|uniref:5-(carboxyamino)imidazole ribonucleotide mutase n=1 Tax=Globicatella sulfidifaciens TaxID=136093 RepID=UPI00288E0DD3|nr:5-(carboxyamino)imidazole ribonucleotide mutase [Globicatella sulfidifaciens]MDT2768136.1 5-(carboxyamino)imidazole ribonucleotide mutase [Globicatella sulfidifaciens]
MITIIMGSSSDKGIAQKVVEQLKEFGLPYKVLVISAHRALDLLLEEVERDEADVYIAMAGKAAHLAGVLAGATIKPVIGIPVKSSTLDGLDALLSTVQMPSGVPVATVAIDGGANAAILAAQILAVHDKDIAAKLLAYKQQMKQNVIKMADDITEL